MFGTQLKKRQEGIAQFLRDALRMHRLALKEVPVQVVIIVFLSLVTAFSGFFFAGTSALLIDQLVEVVNTGVLSPYFTIVLSLALLSMILPDAISFVRDYVDRSFWLRFSTWLHVMFTRATMNVDVARNELPSFQDTRAKADDRGIYPILNVLDSQYAMLADIATLLIASAIIGRESMFFVLILVLGSIPRLVVGLIYGKDVWNIYDAKAEDRRKFFYVKGFADRPEGLMEGHLLGIHEKLLGRMKSIGDAFLAFQLKAERKKVLLGLCAVLAASCALATVYYMAIRLAIGGVISIGGFVFLTAAIARFVDPLQRIFLGASRQYEFSLFAHEVFSIIDAPPSVERPVHPAAIDKNTAPAIEFENVSFHYPGTSHDVLRGVNLKIPAGTSLALVGINGAGKTTLVKLLSRFYDPTEGRILINGIDLRNISLDDWYGMMAILFQHFPTYQSFTAGEGIAFGDATAAYDEARVLAAAKEAGAHEFISGWDNAYAQMIGKNFTNGIEPSRGQDQRLALARMFYRHAHMLILDEPTAAIDAESEEHIFQAIEAMEGKTRVLISHRFSTVRNADQICILDGGVVRELGSHKELIERNGEYARLFHMQAKGYQEDMS